MRRIPPQSAAQMDLIPNFCTPGAVIVLAFMMQLVALVLVLMSSVSGVQALGRLALISFYLQWIGLCSAGLLCWARRWLRLARPGVVFFVCWGMLVLLVMQFADIAYNLAGAFKWVDLQITESRTGFILRHTGIAAIVVFLMLRYFWARNQWQQQVRAEAESRYQALTARIRPHFLFNSLNSIAALIRGQPAAAEDMVVDLSDLFRASLEKRQQTGPLSEEIGLCQAYLRIEKLRLGKKMEVDWDIPDQLMDWPVPMLVIQPLLENAVYHGISLLDEPGRIIITGRELDGRLVITIENPLPPRGPAQRENPGNRIAVDNIAQRLNLIYGDGARLELGQELGLTEPVFRARVYLPRAPVQEQKEEQQ